ncbi:MAG: hypothetical protein FWD38_07035 [Oscillospiraceae bacterium]|nr:hypothetical protein [Oscillospiraceae bacterium]
MRNFLHRFMIGRYGPDHLGIAMIIIAFILSLLNIILWHVPLLYISYLVFGLVIFRMLSRNITRRRAENDKFLRYWWPVRMKIKNIIVWINDKRKYKYYKCPTCKTKLRVPKGKGKIRITCPKCWEWLISES